MPRLRSLLIARHGKLAAERYFGGADATTRFDVRSVTKSVVSLLVGTALASDRLSSLDATVGDHLAAGYSLDAGDRAVTDQSSGGKATQRSGRRPRHPLLRVRLAQERIA